MSADDRNARRTPSREHFTGALLGCGIGDSLGWPVEGKSRAEVLAAGDLLSDFREVRRRDYTRTYPAGSYSDDTQQSLVVAESIVALGRVDPADISRRFHELWRSGQAVGYGKAFGTAMARLDDGVPWDQAADAETPWNGAAMRVGPVGLLDWRRSRERLVADVIASSEVTHRERTALSAAVAVACAIVYALTHDAIDVIELVRDVCAGVSALDPDLAALVDRLPELLAIEPDAARAVILDLPGARADRADGDGVSVVATPSVLATLYAFLHSPRDYSSVVETCLWFGGDVDTFAAMAGFMAGAHLGEGALPAHLVAKLQDGDRIRQLGVGLYRVSLKE